MARFGNSADPSLRLETTTGALGQLQYVAFPVRRTRVSPTEHIETSKRHVLLERSLEDGMRMSRVIDKAVASDERAHPSEDEEPRGGS